MTTILCDMGGTHARLAIYKNGALENTQKLEVTGLDYIEMFESYADQNGLSKTDPVSLYIASSGSMADNGVWHSSNRANDMILSDFDKTRFNLKVILNDFEGSAYALAQPMGKFTKVIYEGPGTADMPKILTGPGTGLGMAIFNHGKVQTTEAGLSMISAQTAEQLEIIKTLEELYGRQHISFEDLVSGRGLPYLYRTVAKMNGMDVLVETPKQVFEAEDNDVKTQTFRLFSEFFGLFCHQAVMMNAGWGGLVLDGGIIQKMHAAGLFDLNHFLKYTYGQLIDTLDSRMKNMPIFITSTPYLGLYGLAAYIELHNA